MQRRLIAAGKAERRREHDVATMMKDGVVVPEAERSRAPTVFRSPSSERISHDSNTSAMNMVRSRSGAGERKCRFCQIAPPTVLGMPT